MKSRIVSQIGMKYLEQLAGTAITGIMMIIFARRLGPDYMAGYTAAMMIVNLLKTGTSAGIGTALIREKHVTEEEYTICAILNVFTGLVLQLVCVAFLLTHVGLKENLFVLSWLLPLDGIYEIYQVKLLRDGQVGTILASTIFGNLSACVLCLLIQMNPAIYMVMALFGKAVYMIVIIPWRTGGERLRCARWRGEKEDGETCSRVSNRLIVENWVRICSFYQYCWKMTVASILETLMVQIRAWAIGIRYSPVQMSFYNQGMQYPQTMMGAFASAAESVVLPRLARIQKEPKRLLKTSVRICAVLLVFSITMMSLLFLMADEFILILLGEKWQQAVPYLRIACVSYAILPVQVICLCVVKACGRSDVFLKAEMMKKVVAIALLAVALPVGPLAIAGTVFIMAVIGAVVNLCVEWKALITSDLGQDESLEMVERPIDE